MFRWDCADGSTPVNAQEFHLGSIGVVGVRIGVLEVYPRMAADIEVHVLVLKVAVTLGLDQVQCNLATVPGSLDVEVHLEMLVALGVGCGCRRDRSGSPPLVERLVAMGRDVLCVAEQLEASVVGLDPVDRSVEVYRLAVGGEDIGPKVVCDARRENDAANDQAKVEALLSGPAGLLAGRKLRPRHMAIVVERSDLLPLGALRRRAQACLGGVVPMEEEGSELGRRRVEGGRGADRKGAGGDLHPGGRSLAIVQLEYTSNGA